MDLLKTGKPVIYVNFSGSAIALNWQDENLPAVVQAFYPGEAAGTALIRLLFGDFNPSGRLPITFYKSIGQLPDFKNYEMEGRTYRYFKGSPLYEFGYGLSFSDFSYKNMTAPASVETGTEVKISVDVKNTGKMDGEEVIQIYIHQEQSSVPVPVRSLAGVKRVFLKTGETKTVEFILKPEQFSLIDKNFNKTIEPGKFLISAGGRQPNDKISDNKSFEQVEIMLTGGLYNICE
jgi:beta-glucosidase